MIIRSICIWVALLAILGFLISSGIVEEDEQKLIKLNGQIAQGQAAYEREKNLKVVLLKQRQELSKKIELETARGQSAKRQLERD